MSHVASGDAEPQGRPAQPDAAAALTADQRSLLMLLAEGLSVAEAAQRMFLSLRTAERRLSAARKALGVATTAEAIEALTGSRRT